MDAFTTLKTRNPVALCRGVGERLRAWRLQRGWTQEELSERSGVGLSTVKAMEKAGAANLTRVARVAGDTRAGRGFLRRVFAPRVRAGRLKR